MSHLLRIQDIGGYVDRTCRLIQTQKNKCKRLCFRERLIKPFIHLFTLSVNCETHASIEPPPLSARQHYHLTKMLAIK